jgi:hypothetical protein
LPPAPPQPSTSSCALSAPEILTKLFREPAGAIWAEIYAGIWHHHYESPSDADLALLIKFAFYSGRDRSLMESMFSEAPLSTILVRGTLDKPEVWRTPKWANAKYRKRSIDAAIGKTSAIYTPHPKPMSDQEMYKMRRQQIHEQRKQK